MTRDDPQLWLLGANIGGADQTDRFVAEGIWESKDPSEVDRRRLAAMREGDYVAIKSAFTQKRDLPFETHGRAASVMRIKALGTIVRVTGGSLLVDWDADFEPRDWYFYTGRQKIWRVPREEMGEMLRDFVLRGDPQDLGYFLADPYWGTRFSASGENTLEPAENNDRFDWIPTYSAIADELIARRNERAELVKIMHRIRRENGLETWHDRFEDGTSEALADVEPGTFMGIFNLGPTPAAKRRKIMRDVCEALGLDMEPPHSFDGIPTTNPQNSWLFRFAYARENAIEDLWDMWETAIAWADSPESDDARQQFAEAFSVALPQSNWTLCTALYRARPNFFPPMDGNTRKLAKTQLGVEVGKYSDKEAPARYLEFRERLERFLAREDSPVHSIPEFSEAAWLPAPSDEMPDIEDEQDDTIAGAPALAVEASAEDQHMPYTLEDLIAEGCFLDLRTLERILEALQRKKNLILQGAPGTGKTWLAKRLGWVLAGYRTGEEVAVVQFHPNTSYEDFVRGYRPVTDQNGNAGLKLVDGPFLRLADKAKSAPGRQYTMVVEEINRGNPARALGEMLTLLEASKRTKEEAIRLTYERREQDGAGVWLPSNLHLIGTMNIADHSLALVDLALRRRFAFVTLAPSFNEAWLAWTAERLGDKQLVQQLQGAVRSLNDLISNDVNLGPSFMVGHSYFTPDGHIHDARGWLQERIELELEPLLQEYWFDNPERVEEGLGFFAPLIEQPLP